MKRLAIKVACLVLPVLGVMAAVNVCVDSGDLFGGRYQKTAEIVVSGHNAGVKIVPANWGSLQVAIVSRNLARNCCTPKDILVFGSSRSSEISGELFPHQTFFNCAVPGGNILDYVALYGLYKKHLLLPRYLFISIDPWTFYTRRDVVVKGETYHLADTAAPLEAKEGMAEYVRYGLKEIGAAAKGRLAPPSFDAGKYLELLTPAYFQASIRSLVSLPLRQVFVTAKEVGAFYIVIRKDGSYSLKDEKQVDCQKVEYQCRKFVDVHRGRFFVYEKTEKSYLAYLYALLAALSRDGVVPIVYFPPVNPAVYDELAQCERNALEGAIKEYCRSKGVMTLGSFDPHLCGLTGKGDFSDEYHPVRSAVRKTFQQRREELRRLGVAVGG